MKVLGEHTEDIKGADKPEEGEDLVEVRDKLFSIIAECQDNTFGNLWTRHAHHVDIILNLTIR